MKARIHDFGGRLRIEVSPESYDERMLLRAFLREHEHCYQTFSECTEAQSDALFVTFGQRPARDARDEEFAAVLPPVNVP